jgi:hypothetical protein
MRAHFGLPSVRGGASFPYINSSPSKDGAFLSQTRKLTNEHPSLLNTKSHILPCQAFKFGIWRSSRRVDTRHYRGWGTSHRTVTTIGASCFPIKCLKKYLFILSIQSSNGFRKGQCPTCTYVVVIYSSSTQGNLMFFFFMNFRCGTTCEVCEDRSQASQSRHEIKAIWLDKVWIQRIDFFRRKIDLRWLKNRYYLEN